MAADNKCEKFEYDFHILPRKSRHSRVAKFVAVISEEYYVRKVRKLSLLPCNDVNFTYHNK